ncbi:MAG TPA: GspH/FimT family pseudopilin [Smithellaceae bacterium]|jgi:type IV fimbrial biogenesis protein FimT|nr:MAG: Fimbrial protein precursor [Bacteroidetes bacterium ADurb.Bin013]HOE23133.1 GspH/FimT family pseudopilin [Smithellaceae bacterium]HOG91918.1 GspH/FimT family pseudopilin [Smithella sp.]HOR62623.1 GspH/FimT family pseudopilin [Smithellaceae bacterium]HOU55570.1 GspH/FimT family pseudopilin [Smithellaceae bacterium]
MRSANNKKWRGGFTMLEIMIVIAIIGIMLGVAAPNFMDYMKSRRLSGAAMQMYVDLMNARQQAVTQNKWVSLRLENSHQYKIFTDSNKNGAIDTGESVIDRDIHPDFADVTFTTSAGTIFAFYPNGTAASKTLTLSGSTGSKSITISTAGRVKIN